MPSYTYDFRKAEKQDRKLHHITIHMPSAETGDKHVVKHYFEGSPRPDQYEFQKEEGLELVRHLEESIGMRDLGKAGGADVRAERDA